MLARLDPDTGDMIVVVAAAGGDGVDRRGLTRMAGGSRSPTANRDYLTEPPRPSTRLVVFDTAAGAETRRLDLTGDVRPEAFSVNGELLFVLDYRAITTGVETINLGTSERYETASRDKTAERENMYGTAVRGVLNADRTLLATLYRNPRGAAEPAFVHILDLRNGWAYCADLDDAVRDGTRRQRPDRALADRHRARHRARTPGASPRSTSTRCTQPSDRPVTIEYRDGPTGPSATELGGPSGFGYVIATLG